MLSAPNFLAVPLRLFASALACLVLTAALPAQDLESILAEARAELEAERERTAAETDLLEGKLSELEAERDRLSDRFVDLELEVASAQQVAGGLRAERAALREQVEGARREIASLPALVREASGKVVDMLEVLPPSGPNLTAEAFQGAVGDTSRGPAFAVEGFVAALGEVMAESQSTGFIETNLRLADGTDQQVELARVGFMTWAYRVAGTDRVGVAMEAPGPDEGARWFEYLTPEASAALNRAMDGFAAGSTGVVGVPLDVTLQMETESTTRPERAFDTILAGGPVIVPLVAIALLAALLILERVLFLGRRGTGSEKLALKVVEHVHGGRHEQALALCESKNIPIARTLGACLKRRDQGGEAMEDAVQETILNELPRMERFLPTIAMLATVSPLLGLLGTVTGMIVTFEMIATLGSGNPRIMAGGISQALITTAAGLVVAIPILLSHSFLAGRVDRLIADMERFSAVLLNLLNGDERPAREGN